jgi:hypothetical protein
MTTMKQSNVGVLRTFRLAAAAVGLCTAASVAGSASAADECITQQMKDSLSACPGGTLKQGNGKKPALSFKSAPQQIQLKKKEDMLKPVNPTASMNAAQRDERRARLKDKSRQLLITEIQQVEALFASTPKNSGDRPKLMRRLAEGYVELEAAAFRDKTENAIKADEAKAKKDAKEKAFRDESGKADKMLGLARQSAVKYYTMLKNQYLKWC